MPDPATKYPHTSAFIAYLAKEYPGHGVQQPSPTEADGDSGGENTNANQEVVKKVVRLLEEEDEDGLKQLVKDTFTFDEADSSLLEQVLLDLMHKHKDDVQGVPFVFLAPMKRPISRPSSRASMHSLRGNRPDTPSSPLARSISLRRPHTPIASPLSAGLHAPPGVIGNGYPGPSPGSSPTASHIAPLSTSTSIPPHLAPGSQPSSPITSPHYLNAKALEFRPSARPGSAMSGTFGAPGAGRNETPSPDLWSHRPNDIIPNSPRRVSGNLAIASPLWNEGYYGRPSSSLTRSNSGLRKSIPADLSEDDDAGSGKAFARIDDDKEFSPFSKVTSMNMPRSTAGTHLNQFEDIPVGPYHYSAHLPSSLMQDEADPYAGDATGDPFYAGEPYDPTGMVGDGMTPFEVLHSIFGSTIPPATLEEALAKTGYDFDSSMVWLIENAHNPSTQSPSGTPTMAQQAPITAAQKLGAASQPVAGSGGRVATASRDILPIMRGGGASATTPGASTNPQHFGQRLAVATGGRVCRYYLAGECRRSDCRFSHDIERALCRFWLRGQCMKGEQCEFLHTLPQDIDLSPLQSAMAGTTLNDGPVEKDHPVDAFPSLSESARLSGPPGAGRGLDPSRTRFANAVKRQPLVTVTQNAAAAQRAGAVQLGVRRIPAGDRTSPATPRPSPRLKLRPPSLLPTLPTGKVVNDLYMSYRAKAIELGGARNVALSRAAEAWKRGDGASAKAFSRQAHELNAKMGKETAEAAEKLVKERARTSLEAAMARDTSWSDDPVDRSTRGKPAGGGLGVQLGVASDRIGGIGASGGKLTSQERTEVLLDLHGLHSSEGVEVMEEFLLALERENFMGLAYIVVGEEKHTGTQDPNRGASRQRLAAGVKEFLHRWQYPWNERDGIVCIDPLTHAS